MTMDPESQLARADIVLRELEAGPEHVIVVYGPQDMSVELDPVAIFSAIAADASSRAESGLRLLSMTSMPLRHAGTAWGNDGSGYQTKVAVAVVYERWPAAPA
jgi:hypothetical protein